MRYNDLYATNWQIVDCENKKFNRIASWCIEKKFVMKYLFMTQNFYKSKLSLFGVQFSEKNMLIKQHYRYLILFIEFKYLPGPNILQFIFHSITYSIVA